MAYFNHSFCKSWLAVGAAPADGTATSAFTAGQMALVDGSTYLVDTPADISAAGHHALLVGGNFHPSDSIGNNPGHGGYQESIKSKGINFRYVSRLGIAAPVVATQATARICVGPTCAPCGENMFVRIDVKGSPALRFLNHNAYAIGDSSGDAAANGASLPGLCCAVGQAYLDPAMALAASMQMLLHDPIIKPFVAEDGAGMLVTKTTGSPQTDFDGVATFAAITTAGTAYVAGTNLPTTASASGTGLTVDITVNGSGAIQTVVVNNPGNGYAAAEAITILGGSGTGALPVATVSDDIGSFTFSQILNGPLYVASTDPVTDIVSACSTVVGAYVSTKFGDCSFDTRDHYNKEPVQIIASILDETGDPCNDCGVLTTTPGQMPQTSGETVLRQLLLTERYMQNPYNQGNADSSRIQEIEGFDPIKTAVNRRTNYQVYYLQHSVPRFNNPSGVFDNDQYLYEIFVDPTDTAGIAAMNTMWDRISTQAVALGNVVLVETGL
tara:strand:+ start:4431 stop:5924 length:1494 start_codon:yes stop_codon:yes gene_type:complete